VWLYFIYVFLFLSATPPPLLSLTFSQEADEEERSASSFTLRPDASDAQTFFLAFAQSQCAPPPDAVDRNADELYYEQLVDGMVL
jgi:hypothetical protein